MLQPMTWQDPVEQDARRYQRELAAGAGAFETGLQDRLDRGCGACGEPTLVEVGDELRCTTCNHVYSVFALRDTGRRILEDLADDLRNQE